MSAISSLGRGTPGAGHSRLRSIVRSCSFESISKGLTVSRIVFVATWVYWAVVLSLACPNNTWITRTSVFASSR